MSIYKQGNKVVRGVSGAVLALPGTVASAKKILDINFDLQIPNKVLKDATNKVRQLTDGVNNIPFVQADSAKQFTYEYTNDYNYPSINPTDTPNGFYKAESLKVDYTKSFFIEIDTERLTASRTVWFDHFLNSDNRVLIDMSGTTAFRVIITMNGNTIINTQIGNVPTGSPAKLLIFVDYENQVAYKIVNGLIQIKNTFVSAGNTIDAPAYIGSNSIDRSYAKIHAIKIFQKRLFEGQKNQGDTINYVNTPFYYYHRYKPNGSRTFYLSSKYLNGAVIDSNTKITSIKDSISESIHYSDGVKCTLKNGFVNTLITGSRINITTPIHFTDKNFYVGMWLKPSSLPAASIFLGSGNQFGKVYSYAFSLTNGKLSLFVTNDGVLNWDYVFIGQSIVYANKWQYVAVIRSGVSFYFYINGLLDSIHTVSPGYRINDSLACLLYYPNASYLGAIDDIFISLNETIITPSGMIGRKDFEPPKRGGFDDTIIQL